jgi:hypothetical protein
MAKLLSDQEAGQLGMRPFGKKHFVHALIEQMKPGEKLLITREDFNWRRQTPAIFVRREMKSTSKKFTVSNTTNRSGWIVERTV